MGINSKNLSNFWDEYCVFQSTRGEPIPEKYEAWHFCDVEASANSLAELVYIGQKTATASLAWSYEADGESIPKEGELSVITLWDETPVCIIETTECKVIPFLEVPASFAYDEGEGDRSLQHWRKVHLDYFTKECGKIGRTHSPLMPVVCERFKVVYRKTGLFST